MLLSMAPAQAQSFRVTDLGVAAGMEGTSAALKIAEDGSIVIVGDAPGSSRRAILVLRASAEAASGWGVRSRCEYDVSSALLRQSQSRGANTRGDVTGMDADPARGPFVFDGATRTYTLLSAGDESSGTGAGLDVSTRGEVAGWVVRFQSDGSRVNRGFVWSREKGMAFLQPLAGDVASQAAGINDAGSVVGRSVGIAYSSAHSPWEWSARDAGNETLQASRAVLWTREGAVDLNTLCAASGWTLEYATDINNRGQIVGCGMNPSGVRHAFRLDPSRESGDHAEALGAPAGESEIVMLRDVLVADLEDVGGWSGFEDGAARDAAYQQWKRGPGWPNTFDPTFNPRCFGCAGNDAGNREGPNGRAGWIAGPREKTPLLLMDSDWPYRIDGGPGGAGAAIAPDPANANAMGRAGRGGRGGDGIGTGHGGRGGDGGAGKDRVLPGIGGDGGAGGDQGGAGGDGGAGGAITGDISARGRTAGRGGAGGTGGSLGGKGGTGGAGGSAACENASGGNGGRGGDGGRGQSGFDGADGGRGGDGGAGGSATGPHASAGSGGDGGRGGDGAPGRIGGDGGNGGAAGALLKAVGQPAPGGRGGDGGDGSRGGSGGRGGPGGRGVSVEGRIVSPAGRNGRGGRSAKQDKHNAKPGSSGEGPSPQDAPR
jgi:hypothetical protein